MTSGLGTGLWSGSSHAADSPGIFKARIEAIDDPNKRNRIQVRVFGYQDDQGTIPKDQLEWVHILSHDSQIPGATSTHNYYPGSEVWVMNTGTEKLIVGSSAGFDGENRLQNNPWGVDNSQDQKPDMPNIIRGDQDTTVRHSPCLMDPTGGPAGCNTYFKYENFKNIVKMLPYSTGKGAPPAPWGQGDVSKQDMLKTIGVNKNVFGSDILNVIQQLDGNLSGAVKVALQIIQNLRNNGFIDAMSVIGAGNFNAALTQYSNQFGSYTQNNLINLLQQLLLYIQQVQQMTPQIFYNLVVQNVVNGIITFLANTQFSVSTDTIADMQNINDNVLLSAGNGTIDFYTQKLNQFKQDFQSAVLQLFNAIIAQINQIAQSVDLNTFITIFGGTQSFINFANLILQIGTYLGMPLAAIYMIGNGAIGLALGGGLNNLPVIQPTNPSNSNNSSNQNPLIGLLAMFTGNNIATQEILSGQLIRKFLSKNPQKYQRVDRNDGPQVWKRNPD